MRRASIAAVAVCVCLLGLADFAAAAPLLNFTQTRPRAEGSFMQVNYTAGNGSFTASGFCDVLRKSDNTDQSIPNGSFSLSANITNAGVGNGSYSLVVTDGLGHTLYRSNALSNPTRIGEGVEDRIDLEFVQHANPGDGALVPDGTLLGVQLDARNISTFNNPNPPVFTSNFANDGTGFFYVFPVPEPTAVVYFGLTTLLVLRRRTR
jgi:hypothetical protein